MVGPRERSLVRSSGRAIPCGLGFEVICYVLGSGGPCSKSSRAIGVSFEVGQGGDSCPVGGVLMEEPGLVGGAFGGGVGLVGGAPESDQVWWAGPTMRTGWCLRSASCTGRSGRAGTMPLRASRASRAEGLGGASSCGSAWRQARQYSSAESSNRVTGGFMCSWAYWSV